jgi:hypothetical protein
MSHFLIALIFLMPWIQGVTAYVPEPDEAADEAQTRVLHLRERLLQEASPGTDGIELASDSLFCMIFWWECIHAAADDAQVSVGQQRQPGLTTDPPAVDRFHSEPAGARSDRSKLPLVLGLSLGLTALVIVIVGVVVGGWYHRRRRTASQKEVIPTLSVLDASYDAVSIV